MWFQGGTECDYLKCKRSIFSYTRSYNYLDADFPRCVQPETSALPRNLPYLSPTTGLSNFRRGATFVLDMTSCRARQDAAHGAARVLAASGRRRRRRTSMEVQRHSEDATANLPSVPENTATPWTLAAMRGLHGGI